MSDHLKSLSQVYLEQIAESAEKVNVKYDPHMDLMAPQVEKEEVEHIDEAPYQIYGSSDGKKKEKKIGKPVKSKSYADARASELENTHKSSGGKYGMKTTRVQYTETLDPVGKEDADVDNDGKKNDSNDKYIMKRRAAIRKAIAKKKVSEGLSTDVENPSTDLKKLVAKAVKRIDTDVDGDVENNDKSKGKFGEFIPSADGKGRVYTKVKEELVIEVSGEDKEEKIKEKKVNNKIIINPELKESISEIGGEVLFISEVEEIDSIVESVHIELIEEGYSEEQVTEALKYAIDETVNKIVPFKTKKAKYSPKSETKKEPKKSLKDRIKSVARKALDTAGGAVGKVMKKKAQIQAAPAKAKKKLGSYVDRAKAVAKAGYDRERGPVEKKKSTPEKKSTSYRGAGVGRKEKIGEEVATDPKMQQLQKKQIHLDRQKLSARVQAMQKKKPAPEQQQEAKNDPCWDSHKMVGMKKKGGKMVPNCVPKEETENVGEEMSVKDQMKISQEYMRKRKPYKAGDHRKANLKKAHVRKPTEREKESSGRYTGGYAGD